MEWIWIEVTLYWCVLLVWLQLRYDGRSVKFATRSFRSKCFTANALEQILLPSRRRRKFSVVTDGILQKWNYKWPENLTCRPLKRKCDCMGGKTGGRSLSKACRCKVLPVESINVIIIQQLSFAQVYKPLATPWRSSMDASVRSRQKPIVEQIRRFSKEHEHNI